MEFIQAIIYGIVQGTTEFLPISSTAHLIIFPYLFNWQDPGLTFDVFLHLGTVVAIISFFLKDWILIFKYFVNKNNNIGEAEEKFGKPSFLLILLVGTIPAAVLGYLLEASIESTFRSPILIAVMLIVFGVILYLADSEKIVRHKRDLKDINYWRSLIIGFAQSIALIPGVSRSGITMTAGLFLGLKREVAARFSFLLATPIMIGATLFRFKEVVNLSSQELFNGFGVLPAIIGFIFALISGYLCIKYLLKFLQKGTFLPFVIYRIILALLIIIIFLLR